MPPRKRYTGPGHTGATPPRSSPRPSRRAPPTSQRDAVARPSRAAHRKSAVRVRPRWHKVTAVALLILGILVIVANDAMLLGGVPTTLLPGGHNEAYLLLGVILAAVSTWWFGWFDRPTRR